MHKTCLAILLLIITFTFIYPKDPDYYVKKNTWYESLLASRENLLISKLQKNKANPVSLDTWYYIGPFSSKPSASFSTSFEPENKIELSETYLNGKLKWNKKSDWKDGVVIDLDKTEDCAHYIHRKITSGKDTTIQIFLGSDDGIKVWLNNKLVHENNINRAARPNQDIIDVKLKKGINSLLIKICNNGGDAGFYFSLINNEPMETLWTILERDFPAKGILQEMNWERTDKIWNDEWQIGNYQELGNRYANVLMGNYPMQYSQASKILSNFKTVEDLWKIRDIYKKVKADEYVVLTPKPSPKPKINGAKVYGVRPGNPFLYRIPATGNKPIEFSANGLPAGLTLDKKTGIISGIVKEKGEYIVSLKAKNQLGKDERKFKIVVGEKIALTPPLGWNSWNCFADAVDEQKVKSAADAMITSGLVNHGWSYINIDDFWEHKPGSSDPKLQGSERDGNGKIITNKKFPSMKNLSSFIHNKGLKIGIYSSPGTLTCGGCTGSYNHEEQDAQSYSEWGIDYLKYDWCSYSKIARDNSLEELKKPYFIMRSALSKTNRDIVYSLCQYGMGNVWEWGNEVGGNCWRTTGDITDTWESMSSIGFNQAGHEKYAAPGNWNDPDMLVVGMVGWGPQLHPTRLTPNEQYTHISLWCLLSAPLLIGCDMTQLDDFTVGLLTNDEVLSINQDALGKQAARVSKTGDFEIWVKDLEDGTKAVGLFNRSSKKAEIAAMFNDFGFTGKCLVRDLWRQKDIGTFDGAYRSFVPAHGVSLVKIKQL